MTILRDSLHTYYLFDITVGGLVWVWFGFVPCSLDSLVIQGTESNTKPNLFDDDSGDDMNSWVGTPPTQESGNTCYTTKPAMITRNPLFD